MRVNANLYEGFWGCLLYFSARHTFVIHIYPRRKQYVVNFCVTVDRHMFMFLEPYRINSYPSTLIPSTDQQVIRFAGSVNVSWMTDSLQDLCGTGHRFCWQFLVLAAGWQKKGLCQNSLARAFSFVSFVWWEAGNVMRPLSALASSRRLTLFSRFHLFSIFETNHRKLFSVNARVCNFLFNLFLQLGIHHKIRVCMKIKYETRRENNPGDQWGSVRSF